MQGRARGWLVPWLLVAVAGQVAAYEVVRQVFVGTARGQLLDTAAISGNTIGHRHIDGLVDTVLSAVTVALLVVATIVIGFIALIRGRVVLAVVATLLVVGANLTTQLLKAVTDRPDYGVDLARAAAGNSLPSGHTTLAASVAVALVLVLPARLRGAAGLLGAGYAALAGVATLSAGWHRPSDAVAALLVVGAWAAGAGLVLVAAQRPDADGPAGRPHRFSLVALVVAGSVLLAAATAALVATDRALSTPVELLSHGRLLTAYAGGAAGIAGTAGLVMALVLATAHLTVPDRGLPRWSGRSAGPAGGRPAAPARVR
jgi:membrane-associated phospholipid phosphatase